MNGSGPEDFQKRVRWHREIFKKIRIRSFEDLKKTGSGLYPVPSMHTYLHYLPVSTPVSHPHAAGNRKGSREIPVRRRFPETAGISSREKGRYHVDY